MTQLKDIFLALAGQCPTDPQLPLRCWQEIEAAYQQQNRHYHTLAHLQDLQEQLEAAREYIRDYDALQWALFYHDIVYNPLRRNNEEKSAELAAQRMAELQVAPGIIHTTRAAILATKAHEPHQQDDINIFTDADLSVLGRPWEDYLDYTEQIRSEYSIFPDILYKPGRRKTLKQFLRRDIIYKTPYFTDRLEEQARHNMQKECAMLS